MLNLRYLYDVQSKVFARVLAAQVSLRRAQTGSIGD